MNQTVKKSWLEALRSGDFEQGTRALRTEDNRFCCLGVLCEIAAKEGVIPPAEFSSVYGKYSYGDDQGNVPRSQTYLPYSVQKWADLAYNPQAEDGYLAKLNDKGFTFKSIADIIEKEF